MKRSPRLMFTLLALGTLPLWAETARPSGEGRFQRQEGERPRRMGVREAREGTPPPVERYLHYLRKTNPEEYQRMKTLQEEDPGAFRRELREKVMSRRRELSKKHHSRGVFKEEMKAVRQAASAEEREQAVAALRAKVAAQVEENLKRREERMKQVRAQLQELEERHVMEREQKEQLIDRHVEKLLEKLEPEAPTAKD